MKKLLSLIFSTVIIITSVLCVNLSSYAKELNGSTVVVYTSNLRGDINKLAGISAVKKDFENKGADVILADTGNFLQGSAYASKDRGYTVFTLMEKAGYDVVGLGAFDFAFSTAQTGAKPHGTLVQYLTLSQLLNGGSEAVSKDASTIKAVSTNATGSNSCFTFEGNMTHSAVVKNILFTAVTDPAVNSMVLEEGINGVTINDTDIYTMVNTAIGNTSADYKICLSNYSGLDSEKINADSVISSTKDFSVNALIISENNEASTQKINLDDYEADDALKAEIDEVAGAIDEELSERAYSSVTLNGSTNAVRSGETNLGNLWTDALRWYATSGNIIEFFEPEEIENGNTSIKVDEENIVAIWNGGNLRDFIYQGNITLSDIHKVLPYPNTVAIMYVTGAQLDEALEASMQYNAAFASVSGMTYTINCAEFKAGKQYNNSNYFAPLSNKVEITSVNGKPFDKNATYAVVTSNMIYNGGDTYSAFSAKQNGSTVTKRKVVDAVWEYILSELDGNIGQQYATTQGRITISPNHTTKVKTTPATCGKAGSKTYICTVCNTTTKTETIKPTGKHNYTSKVTTAPTSKKAGTMTYTCKTCGSKYTKSIAKLPTTSIKKLTATKKGFKATWTKKSVTGYQLQYSAYSNFKSAKTVTISKAGTTSKSVSKLKAKKKYYVRIRTYKTINGKKYYSSWSAKKTVTTKK